MKQFNLNEYLANPSRKVVTRDGRSVRIIGINNKCDRPIVGLVCKNGREVGYDFQRDGSFGYEERGADLFFDEE